MSVPGRFRVWAVDPPHLDLVRFSPDNNTRRGADRSYATDIAGLDQAPQPYRPHLAQRLLLERGALGSSPCSSNIHFQAWTSHLVNSTGFPNGAHSSTRACSARPPSNPQPARCNVFPGRRRAYLPYSTMCDDISRDHCPEARSVRQCVSASISRDSMSSPQHVAAAASLRSRPISVHNGKHPL